MEWWTSNVASMNIFARLRPKTEDNNTAFIRIAKLFDISIGSAVFVGHTDVNLRQAHRLVFPAVTVCNMSPVKKSAMQAADLTKRTRRRKRSAGSECTLLAATQTQRAAVDVDYCYCRTTLVFLPLRLLLLCFFFLFLFCKLAVIIKVNIWKIAIILQMLLILINRRL